MPPPISSHPRILLQLQLAKSLWGGGKQFWDEEAKEAIESSLLGVISWAICVRILWGSNLSWRMRGINSGGRLVPFHRILGLNLRKMVKKSV